MDRATEIKKIDEAYEEKQRKDKEFFAIRDAQDALYRTTVGIIQAEIVDLLTRNSQMIVDKVKRNASVGTYYNSLTNDKKEQLLVRATKMAADEFFKCNSPFFQSSQENSQENGLHILLQLPKNMQ
jgi:hypothetical protein